MLVPFFILLLSLLSSFVASNSCSDGLCEEDAEPALKLGDVARLRASMETLVKDVTRLKSSISSAHRQLKRTEQRLQEESGREERDRGWLEAPPTDIEDESYYSYPWIANDIHPDLLEENPQAAHYRVRRVPLKGMRPAQCDTQPCYDDDEALLPAMSVIVSFRNEGRYGLESTIKSVLAQTPAALLHELILVSDGNEEEPPLPRPLPRKVRLIRSEKRLGMFAARMLGADAASGDVLVFLDSHIEATPGWAEPLLYEVQRNRSVVAVPLVDAIDDLTLEYKTTIAPPRGGWEFENLNFLWNIPNDAESVRRAKSAPESFEMPAMPGGLFAVSRDWFYEIGAYDLGLDTWGGENVETSIRVWALGGAVRMVPCSRVGHIFRSSEGRVKYNYEGDFPYDFPSGGHRATVWKNMARVVDLWVDDPEQLQYWYSDPVHSELPGRHDESLHERRTLLRRLGARSFQWYIDSIYPSMKEHLEAQIKAMKTPGTVYFQRAQAWAKAHPEIDWKERINHFKDDFQ